MLQAREGHKRLISRLPTGVFRFCFSLKNFRLIYCQTMFSKIQESLGFPLFYSPSVGCRNETTRAVLEEQDFAPSRMCDWSDFLFEFRL